MKLKINIFLLVAVFLFIATQAQAAYLFVCFKNLKMCLENHKYSTGQEVACQADILAHYIGLTTEKCYGDLATCQADTACKVVTPPPGTRYAVCDRSNATAPVCKALIGSDTKGYLNAADCTTKYENDPAYVAFKGKGPCLEEASCTDFCKPTGSSAPYTYGVCLLNAKQCVPHQYDAYLTNVSQDECSGMVEAMYDLGNPPLLTNKKCYSYAKKEIATPNTPDTLCAKECEGVIPPPPQHKFGVCLKDSKQCVPHVYDELFKALPNFTKSQCDTTVANLYDGKILNPILTTRKCYDYSAGEMNQSGACEKDCGTPVVNKPYYFCDRSLTTPKCAILPSSDTKNYQSPADCLAKVLSDYPNIKNIDRCWTQEEFTAGTCDGACKATGKTCTDEGENKLNTGNLPCCSGLKERIAVSAPDIITGKCVSATAGYICTAKCGNGVQDAGENVCNCPDDFKQSKFGVCVTNSTDPNYKKCVENKYSLTYLGNLDNCTNDIATRSEYNAGKTNGKCYVFNTTNEMTACGDDCAKIQPPPTNEYYVCINKKGDGDDGKCVAHKYASRYATPSECTSYLPTITEYQGRIKSGTGCYTRAQFDDNTCANACKYSQGEKISQNVLFLSLPSKARPNAPSSSMPWPAPGFLKTDGNEFAGFKFTFKQTFYKGELDSYDTVILAYADPAGLVLEKALDAAELEKWVRNGGKLIRYNGGYAAGESNYELDINGIKFFKKFVAQNNKKEAPFNIMEDSLIANSKSSSPQFIDVANMKYPVSGNESFMNAKIWPMDEEWCASTQHVSNASPDAILAYRNHGKGLIIYNGFYFSSGFKTNPAVGVSDLSDNLTKVWLQELKFPWGGNPVICNIKIAKQTSMPTGSSGYIPARESLKSSSAQISVRNVPKVANLQVVNPLSNFAFFVADITGVGDGSPAIALFEVYPTGRKDLSVVVGKIENVTSPMTFVAPALEVQSINSKTPAKPILIPNTEYTVIFRVINAYGTAEIQTKFTTPKDLGTNKVNANTLGLFGS